jgi:hypothetical protein
MDISMELDAARGEAGEPLTQAQRRALQAAVDPATINPDAAWERVADMVIGGRGGMTLWHACCLVEPWLARQALDSASTPTDRVRPGPAIIMAALRHATGTIAEHQRRAAQRRTWPTLADYYQDDPDREGSREVDYGVMWAADGRPTGWPKWRVSYVTLTGEMYAVRQTSSSDNLVVLVGFASTREDAEQRMKGWAEPDVAGHDLRWVFQRFGRQMPAVVMGRRRG